MKPPASINALANLLTVASGLRSDWDDLGWDTDGAPEGDACDAFGKSLNDVRFHAEQLLAEMDGPEHPKANTRRYREVKDLFDRLADAGYPIVAYNNGETQANVTPDTALMDEVLATDECHVYIKDGNDRERMLFLVHGNEPGVLVADHSSKMPLAVDAILDTHYERWA
jgi:hypothetical protein